MKTSHSSQKRVYNKTIVAKCKHMRHGRVLFCNVKCNIVRSVLHIQKSESLRRQNQVLDVCFLDAEYLYRIVLYTLSFRSSFKGRHFPSFEVYIWIKLPLTLATGIAIVSKECS